jgi:hypothetical protein
MAAFFRSVKLTIVLLSLIAVTCVIGALVPQSPLAPDDGAVEVSKLGALVRWCFRWHDIYRSPLFVALLTLLAVNVIVCSLKTSRRPTSRNIGWILTHASIVVILGGVLVGQLTGDSGMMKLYEGESSRVAERADGTQLDLGFTMTLDQFAIEYHDKPTERLLVLHAGVEQAFPATLGREYRLHDGAGLKIVDHIPHAATHMQVADSETGEINPAVRIVVEGNGRTTGNWVFAAEWKETRFFEGAISVRYAWCDTGDAYTDALSAAILPEQDTLIVHVQGTDIVKALPVAVGEAFPINGTEYIVKTVRYLPDFRKDKDTGEPYSASDEPRNPALEVEVSEGEESAKRWAFSKFPDFWKMHSDGKEKGLDLRYVRPAEHVVRLVDRDGSGITLVWFDAEGGAQADLVQIGQKAKLGETGWTIKIAERLVRPRFTLEATPSLDPRAGPAIQVSMDPADGTAENSVWLTPNTTGEMGQTKLLYSREFRPKQYISDVTFVVNGDETVQGKVKVNAPLTYRGFKFYQSSYGDDGGLFSVLQVKRDAGAPIVYIGFALLCVGLLYVFYIKPLLTKKGGTKSAPAK